MITVFKNISDIWARPKTWQRARQASPSIKFSNPRQISLIFQGSNHVFYIHALNGQIHQHTLAYLEKQTNVKNRTDQVKNKYTLLMFIRHIFILQQKFAHHKNLILGDFIKFAQFSLGRSLKITIEWKSIQSFFIFTPTHN